MQDGSAQAPTPVMIYGRTYHLRGEGGSAYVSELAAAVDQKMREVAEATGTADTLKVAILAALNLADEKMQARRATVSGETEERLSRLVAQLDEALAE